MAKVEIKTAVDEDYARGRVQVLVDGKSVLNQGCGGGEPEDNTFGRDWNWVPSGLEKLAKTLGAEVVVVETSMEDLDG